MKKKYGYYVIVIFMYFLTGLTYLHSVPHINGRNPGPKEYVRRTKQIKTVKGAVSKTITATGARKIAIIMVNFASAGTSTSGNEIMSSDDIRGLNYNFSYLRNFYLEASYRKLDIEITFFFSTGSASSLSGNETPFTLSTPMSTYGQ